MKNEFTPFIKLFRHDNKTFIIFDSMSDTDLERSTSIHALPDYDLTSLQLRTNGFEFIDTLGTDYICKGSIDLYILHEGKERTVRLAQCTEMGNFRKKQNDYAKTIQRKIRQGAAKALTTALDLYYETQDSPLDEHCENLRSQCSSLALENKRNRIPVSRQPSIAINDTSRWRTKMLVAIIFVPLMVLAIKGLLPTPNAPQPIQPVSLEPSSPEKQIDLTREVLKQMGLDSKTNTDLGCLIE